MLKVKKEDEYFNFSATPQKFSDGVGNEITNDILNFLKNRKSLGPEETYEDCVNAVTEIEKENPLFLLTEYCGNDCLLSRHISDYGKTTEDGLMTGVQENMDLKDKLIYASFCPGYFFQDLVILTKLISLGYKKIDTHFIEDKTEYLSFEVYEA